MRIERESSRYIVVETGDTIEDLIDQFRQQNLRTVDGIAFEGRGTLFIDDETHMEDYVAY